MSQASNYLTLNRAAQQLGVHEQTLRSWERKGLIRMARLPQSGYRRVPVEEVERLQAAMLSGKEPVRVRLDPPRQDPASLANACAWAGKVRTEVAELAANQTFDEFLRARRGRA